MWLFHANSIRLASAMGAGGDYAIVVGGRYQLTNNIYELKRFLEMMKKIYKNKAK